MTRLASAIVLAGAVLAPALHAQANPAQPNAGATPEAACPSTASLDDLVKAIDAAVSGPANKDRTCLRDVLAADARLIPVVKHPDGSYGPRVLTVEDWINLVAKRGSSVFFEKQLKVKTESYGHIAHLWSTYETRSGDGKAMDRGINSIQAVYDGTRWKVIEIVWPAETPAEPVPEKYLP